GECDEHVDSQVLLLTRRTYPSSKYPLGARAQPLEQDLERRLAVIDHERHLARPDLHDDLGAQNRPVAPAESGIEEARIVRADLPRPGVVDDHLGRELRGYPDPLLGKENVEPVGFEDVRVAR